MNFYKIIVINLLLFLILSTNWSSQPYFKGSYSYCKVGGESRDHESMSMPIVFNNVIFKINCC